MLNREILLLNKYFDVDEEKRIVTISKVFDKASDFIDNSLDNKEYMIQNDVMNEIVDKMKLIPRLYRIDLRLRINDYESFDKEKVFKAFQDEIEMNHYSLERERRIKWLKTVLLFMVGVMILFLNAAAKTYNWYGSSSELSYNVLTEAIDIIAWVFIWESVSVLFLTPSELPYNSNRLKIRVREITFIDENQTLIGTIEFDKETLKWDSISKLDKISKTMALIGGASFIGIGITDIIYQTLISFVFEMQGSSYDNLITILFLLVSIVFDSLLVIAGIGTLSEYAGKPKFKNATKIISWGLFLIMIIMVSLSIALHDKSLFSTLYYSTVAFIIYLTGYILQCIITHFKKRNKKKFGFKE